jgi:hypothetical protein
MNCLDEPRPIKLFSDLEKEIARVLERHVPTSRHVYCMKNIERNEITKYGHRNPTKKFMWVACEDVRSLDWKVCMWIGWSRKLGTCLTCICSTSHAKNRQPLCRWTKMG